MFEITWKKCTHDKITAHVKAGYCPDCGEYVTNRWYISRCNCCGIKQKIHTRNGKIITDSKFCKNCGSNIFITQELESLDIVNINYAAVIKQTVRTKHESVIQTWIDQNGCVPMKLLPSY